MTGQAIEVITMKTEQSEMTCVVCGVMNYQAGNRHY